MIQKAERKYTKLDVAAFRVHLNRVGANVKELAKLTGQSDRQVRRTLKKLDEGKEIGKRGYGKAKSLNADQCNLFMKMLYSNNSRTEIQSQLGLSDSKFGRIKKLVLLPQCLKITGGTVAVEVSCRYTTFYIAWYLDLDDLKVSFSQSFEGEMIHDNDLCLKLIEIISHGYEDEGKSISYFDAVEGRKVEKFQTEQQKYDYYMNYFQQLTPKLEMMEEMRKYFGLTQLEYFTTEMKSDIDVLTKNENITSSFEIEEMKSEDNTQLPSSEINSDSDNEIISENESEIASDSEPEGLNSSPLISSEDNHYGFVNDGISEYLPNLPLIPDLDLSCFDYPTDFA